MDIQGKFDEKFKSIVDCYENQFALNLDIGSSLAISYHGEVVVDIWAGTRDKAQLLPCLLYTSPSPRDKRQSRMPSSA